MIAAAAGGVKPTEYRVEAIGVPWYRGAGYTSVEVMELYEVDGVLCQLETAFIDATSNYARLGFTPFHDGGMGDEAQLQVGTLIKFAGAYYELQAVEARAKLTTSVTPPNLQGPRSA